MAALALFGIGYGLQRFVIGHASHGKDENILLVTLGLSVVIENLALYFWRSDTRTIETSYSFDVVDFGVAFIPVPRSQIAEGKLLPGALVPGEEELSRQFNVSRITARRALAELAVTHDMMVSFSGILTFNKAREVQHSAQVLPLQNLLVETDAPYLAPVPLRGKRNEVIAQGPPLASPAP